jgi:hypothetical protein
MSGSHDFNEFLGRVGCLFIQKGLSPPFRLKMVAREWFFGAESAERCLDQIAAHLHKYSRRRRRTGDDGLSYLEHAFRQSLINVDEPPSPKSKKAGYGKQINAAQATAGIGGT